MEIERENEGDKVKHTQRNGRSDGGKERERETEVIDK